jgi:hypothetical protein
MYIHHAHNNPVTRALVERLHGELRNLDTMRRFLLSYRARDQRSDHSHSNTFQVRNASYSQCLIAADASRHFHFMTVCSTGPSTRFPPDNIEPERLKKEVAENKARKVQRRTISRLLLLVSLYGCDVYLNREGS